MQGLDGSFAAQPVDETACKLCGHSVDRHWYGDPPGCTQCPGGRCVGPADSTAAFCPDCDDVHRDGECVLVAVPRDPLWIRVIAWISERTAR